MRAPVLDRPHERREHLPLRRQGSAQDRDPAPDGDQVVEERIGTVAAQGARVELVDDLLDALHLAEVAVEHAIEQQTHEGARAQTTEPGIGRHDRDRLGQVVDRGSVEADDPVGKAATRRSGTSRATALSWDGSRPCTTRATVWCAKWIGLRRRRCALDEGTAEHELVVERPDELRFVLRVGDHVDPQQLAIVQTPHQVIVELDLVSASSTPSRNRRAVMGMRGRRAGVRGVTSAVHSRERGVVMRMSSRQRDR